MDWTKYVESIASAAFLIFISFMLVNMVKSSKEVKADIKKYEDCIEVAKTVSGMVGNTRAYEDCKLESRP